VASGGASEMGRLAVCVAVIVSPLGRETRSGLVAGTLLMQGLLASHRGFSQHQTYPPLIEHRYPKTN
jgi:hypothetical protein